MTKYFVIQSKYRTRFDIKAITIRQKSITGIMPKKKNGRKILFILLVFFLICLRLCCVGGTFCYSLPIFFMWCMGKGMNVPVRFPSNGFTFSFCCLCTMFVYLLWILQFLPLDIYMRKSTNCRHRRVCSLFLSLCLFYCFGLCIRPHTIPTISCAWYNNYAIFVI